MNILNMNILRRKHLGGLLLTATLLAACTTGGPADTLEVTAVLGTPFLSANDIVYVILPQELGYWEEEGLDVEVQTAASGEIQLLDSGQAQFAFGGGVQTLAAQGEGVGITAVYSLLRKHATAIAVLEDSDFMTPQDLKGMTIGIIAEGSGRALDGRAMIEAAGMDPGEDITWLPVGLGPGALQALTSDEVQALVLFDAAYASMENMGAEFRYFTFPFQEGLHSVAWNSSDEFISENEDAVVGFGRGTAKATLFAMTNPEAATRIFLEAYPELIADGVSEEKAFSDALNILMNNLANMQLEPGALYGDFPAGVWEKMQGYHLEVGTLEKRSEDITKLSVPNEMVEAMNDFDHDAVIDSAQNWP